MVTAAFTAALDALQGLPLWAAGRAVDLLWWQFGAKVRAPTKRDPDRIAGEYALHLQCAWRISGPTGVVVGSQDVQLPADPGTALDSFAWDVPGRSLSDKLLRGWFDGNASSPLVVESIAVDRCGGFVLHLGRDFALEVFPHAGAASDEGHEQWRLLRPGVDVPHFVVGNTGVKDPA